MNATATSKNTFPEIQRKKSRVFIWFLKGFLGVGFTYLLLQYLFSISPSYDWVYNALLKQNMQLINQYPDVSFEQKMALKLGASYEYLYYIKQQTPPDAVILYPSADAFRVKGNPFTQEIHNKLFATRFLYPRRLVQREELQKSPYADKITHVAIVNGVGLDLLPYQADSTIQHAVLPLYPNKN